MTTIYDFKSKINKSELTEISELLKNGKLVIFPTETVYGIGANALNKEAVDNIFIAKGRPNDNPIIVHVSASDKIKDYAKSISKIEQKLIDAFMPGPFTIILKKKNIIPNNVSANLDTIGIRIPSNKIAKKILEACDLPIAAPSANISSKPSGTKVSDIFEEFNNKVSAIVDGGNSKIGLESTVVKVIDNIPTILRPGKITKEDIEKVIGVCNYSESLNEITNGVVESPGMKYKHYAPQKPCTLIYNDDEDKLLEILRKQDKNTIIIGPDEYKYKFKTKVYLTYGSINNLNEISHNIFSLLREADHVTGDSITIVGVKKEGLGIAIMNRLLKSASYNYIEK